MWQKVEILGGFDLTQAKLCYVTKICQRIDDFTRFSVMIFAFKWVESMCGEANLERRSIVLR